MQKKPRLSVFTKVNLNKVFNILATMFLVLTCAFVILFASTNLGIFLTLAIICLPFFNKAVGCVSGQFIDSQIRSRR